MLKNLLGPTLIPLHHMSWSSDTQHPLTRASTVTDARIDIIPLKTLTVDEHILLLTQKDMTFELRDSG